MVDVVYEGFAVHHCEKCKGYLVRSGRAISIKNQKNRSAAELLVEGDSEAAPDGTYQHCPGCQKKMSAKKPAGLDFQIDVVSRL